MTGAAAQDSMQAAADTLMNCQVERRQIKETEKRGATSAWPRPLLRRRSTTILQIQQTTTNSNNQNSATMCALSVLKKPSRAMGFIDRLQLHPVATCMTTTRHHTMYEVQVCPCAAKPRLLLLYRLILYHMIL